MYIVELGTQGDYDYYPFRFERFSAAMNFIEILVEQKYCPSIRYEEE